MAPTWNSELTLKQGFLRPVFCFIRFVSAYEVEVLRVALIQLQCQTEQFSTAAILSDPKVALLAINSTLAPQSTFIEKCFSCLEDLASIGRWPLEDPR
ncbi:hypothetical protein TNCV_869671 [Trichonephila clavipes]|nr:hypothetical protein TNCV_869671 [Trichonephila clavipes]